MAIIERQEQIIIIGAGIAGTITASRLRKYNFTGKIILIDHGDFPYDRPPLTKEFLTGEMTEDEVSLRKETFYDEHDIDLLLHTEVTHINPDQKTITLHNGRILQWDKLCLATGVGLRRLSRIDQHQFDNVFYLRTFYQAKKFKDALKNIDHLVIIGAGFIGLEVAASLRKLGKEVTVIMSSKVPLGRILGEEMGEYIAKLHEANGVTLMPKQIADKFIGKEGKLSEIITADGTRIACDGVLVSIGVTSHLTLAENILDIEKRGIVVDKYGETSSKDIYAAGDVVTWPDSHSETNIQSAHWEHAFAQGTVVAQNMIKRETKVYEKIPYFWSDQYTSEFEYLGQPVSWDQTVIRGEMESDQFSVFYLEKDKIVGAFFVNKQDEVPVVKKLMKAKQQVAAKALEKTNIALESLLA